MPELNTFLSRALASDPLMTSMTLLPKKTGTSHPPSQPSLQLECEDIHTQAGNLNLKPVQVSIPASESPLEQALEVSDSDSNLPSSVVEEIEVCSLIFILLVLCVKFYIADLF
jgi:hypothetical protein